MVEVARWQGVGYLVGPRGARHQGLVIHGYGGNSEEMLGLAVGNACRLDDVRMLVFDLPGHNCAGAGRKSNGETQEFEMAAEKVSEEPYELLTLNAALRSVEAATSALTEPSFFIGHSLGARLGFKAGLPLAVAISMPGPADFSGSRRELLTTLRARRVREAARYKGLEEILSDEVEPAPETFLLRAARDIDSVKTLTDEWQARGIRCLRINDCNHNDIVSSREAREAIADWLKEKLA